MKIGDIKKRLAPLLDDAYESEKLFFKKRDSQFYRRVYIRSVFAYIEGSIWILKQVCLNAKSADGKRRKINMAEYAILSEESYDLKNNGDIKIGTKNINILDNIKFTFKTINKLFSGNIDIGTGTDSWNKLIAAKNIRNRIMHPKNLKDLDISDDEIAICEEVCSWFNIRIKDCFEAFVRTTKENTQ